jgi:hypothetical protein
MKRFAEIQVWPSLYMHMRPHTIDGLLVKGPEGLAVEWIDALIRHALFPVMPRQNARAI